MKALAACLLLIMLLTGASRIRADDPTPLPTTTPTDTPTTTATYSNTQRAGLSTVAPPAACGNVYNPCAGLPWAVPFFPTLALASPTLIYVYADIPPTVGVGTPTLTLTASITSTPPPTAVTADVGALSTLAGSMNDTVLTLNAMGTVEVTLNGTAASIPDIAQGLGTSIPSLFSTIRGITAATNNKTMSLVAFVFTIFVFVVLVHLLVMLLPVILRIVEFILNVINTFKPV